MVFKGRRQLASSLGPTFAGKASFCYHLLMREIIDHWTHRARREGYPARSVYKLKEIDKRFGLLPKGGKILDLGAAPGSWSLFALRRTGPQGRVTAVDLQPLSLGREPKNLDFILGDFTTPAVLETLEKAGPYDCLISDAAPATTGNRTVDTARSEFLVEEAIGIARRFLRPGGTMAVKIFQGSDRERLLGVMREMFTSARAFKPRAVRSESFEIYFIGLQKKG